jgi:hypothetical protein
VIVSTRVVFPLRAGAVGNGEHLLVRVAGEAITGEALHKRDQLPVAVEHLVEEPSPARAVGVRLAGNATAADDQVGRGVRAQSPGAQIKGAVLAGEKERVAVELVDGERERRLAGLRVERTDPGRSAPAGRPERG